MGKSLKAEPRLLWLGRIYWLSALPVKAVDHSKEEKAQPRRQHKASSAANFGVFLLNHKNPPPYNQLYRKTYHQTCSLV